MVLSHKPLIYEIVAGVVRWKLYLDWVLSHFVRKEIKKDVRYLLWMTLYQLFFMHKAAYHVVDEVVEHVKRTKGQSTASFVNAVLRRSLRERDDLKLPSDPLSRLSIEHSFPLWLVKRWLERFGVEETTALLDRLNKSPEFSLRVDTGLITKAEATRRLSKIGIEGRDGRYVEDALRVDRIGPLLTDDLLSTGFVHIQDETSQMAVLALAPSPFQLVLDACAGQGTKTGQIRQISRETRIVAMDRDRHKLLAIDATPQLIQADALRNPFKNGCFDSILLDAPCSSLGIIGKHPEIKWRRREIDILKNGAMQKEMVKALSSSLRSGGRLIYSVCSFEPEETLDVVDEIKRTGALVPDKALPGVSDDAFFLSLPHKTGLDGFFIASFTKP